LTRPNSEKRLEELDRIVSALAHASRRHILLVIRFRGGSMTAGEINDRFHHTWPTTSRHLRVLEEAGLIACEKKGRVRTYRVRFEKLDVIKKWLDWFEDFPRLPY
jgi:DNA-binding transcriptional ArsR family regulator